MSMDAKSNCWAKAGSTDAYPYGLRPKGAYDGGSRIIAELQRLPCYPIVSASGSPERVQPISFSDSSILRQPKFHLLRSAASLPILSDTGPPWLCWKLMSPQK